MTKPEYYLKDGPADMTKMQFNPEVTVRMRGVMEKCSFCTQRIQQAKIAADKENRPIADGEIETACQQACPSKAIVFGNLNDKTSRVAKQRMDKRSYGVLANLNTRPRTTYVAEVMNPNAEIEAGTKGLGTRDRVSGEQEINGG